MYKTVTLIQTNVELEEAKFIKTNIVATQEIYYFDELKIDSWCFIIISDMCHSQEKLVE